MASLSVHADDYINNHQAVAPPMHVSTTFRYAENPDDLKPWENLNVCLLRSLLTFSSNIEKDPQSRNLTNTQQKHSPMPPMTPTSTPATRPPTPRVSRPS